MLTKLETKKNIFHRISLKSKLIIAFLLLSIIPFLTISLLLLSFFQKDIEKQTFNQLISVRQIKKEQTIDYLNNLKKRAINFSNNPLTQVATSSLSIAFSQWGDELAEAEQKAQIAFINGSEEQWSPNADKGAYEYMHNQTDQKFHSYFKRFINQFEDYEDLFLVTLEGSIIYSFKKEKNFGTNLIYGPYASENIGMTFQKILSYTETDEFEALQENQQKVLFYFTDFSYDPASNKIVAYAGMPIFSGDFIEGIIMYQISPKKLNDIMAERAGLRETGETFLVGSEYMMRSDSFIDPEKYSVKNSFLNSRQGLAKSPTIISALKGNTGEDIVISYHGEKVMSAYTSLEKFGVTWALLSEMTLNEAKQGTATLRNIILMIALISIIIIIFIALLLSNSIAKPLILVTNRLKDIAEGEGDLTQRLKLTTSDELGELSASFNQFVSKIHDLIKEIKSTADTLSSSAEELSSSTEEMKQNSEQISNAIVQEASATHQSSTTIINTVRSLESMFQDIKEIHGTANKAEKIASHGSEVVDKTNETMTNIEKSTQKIEGVIGVITSIANNTNLLALNAAIEAAKAGETGKGFAVVAEEVRTLAEKSRESVIEIQSLINTSSKSVQEGTEVIQQMQDLLAQFIEHVQNISGSLNNIADVMTEQEVGIQDVSKGVEIIAELSQNNEVDIQALTQTLNETAQTSLDLSKIAEDLSAKVNVFKVD